MINIKSHREFLVFSNNSLQYLVSFISKLQVYREREMKQLETDFNKMVKMLNDNNKNN